MSVDKTASQFISKAISRVLGEGLSAVLVTLTTLPQNQSAGCRIGAKLLVLESGERVGTLGVTELDEAVARETPRFLAARDEAKTIKVDEFEAELREFQAVGLLFERIEAEPRLVVAGAGHVGASLARLAALAGYRVTLIDDRSEFVTRKLFNSESERSIELIAAGDWAEAMKAAIGNGRTVSVAIVTRGHKQDEDCLRAAIFTSPDYIGMIGSKRRT